MSAIAKSEQGSIGSTTMQIKRLPTGDLQAVKGVINLSLARKQLVQIKGTMTITATGYDRLNQVAGLSLVLPKQIQVPGHNGMQTNPFFVINETTGAIKFVMAKMSAVGYSPIGSMCVVDQTLLFDLGAYFKMDAMAKLKYNKGMGKIVNKLTQTKEELAAGIFLPILDENFGIWLDAAHEEFIKLMSEHQQRQRFAERIALGILKRNCLRHHPSIATSVVQPQNGEAAVTVMGYRHELCEERIRELVDGDRAGVEVIEKEVHTDTIEASDMTASASDAKITEGEDGTPDIRKAELTPKESIMVRINEIRSFMGEESYLKFYNETVTSGRPLNEFEDDELERYASILEKEARGDA